MLKTALITGGSSGIGLEVGKILHRENYNVILIARRKHLLENEVGILNSIRSNSAQFIVADLSVHSAYSVEDKAVLGLKEVETFISTNQIDLLINNAGFGSFGMLESNSIDQEEKMVLLNCVAPLRLTHAALPQMKSRKAGAIVTLSSLAGFQPLPYMATYAATKAFDLFFGTALHQEVKSFGITSLTVCPGPVDTQFAGVARVPGKVTGASRDSLEKVAQEIVMAIKSKKEICIPGTKAKLYLPFIKLLPLKIRNKIVERMLRSTLLATQKN